MTSEKPAIDRVLLACAATALVAVFCGLAIQHYWLRDLKFDDAYIHFRYAANIAGGKGFVYNEGERVLGSGGPLWNVLLAGLTFVVGPEWLPGAVSAVNFLALVACAAVLLLVLVELVPTWVALVLTTVLFAAGPLVTSSIGGMETVFLCLLYFLAFLALLRDRPVLAALAAGIAFGFRVESLGLAGGVVLATLLYRRAAFWRVVLAAAVVPVGLTLWEWAYFGSVIPNSTLAKSIAYVNEPLWALLACVAVLHQALPIHELLPFDTLRFPDPGPTLLLWGVLMGFGYRHVRRRSPAAALVVLQPIFALAMYTATNPLMFDWYHCTHAPVAMVFAMLGIVELGLWIPVAKQNLRYALPVVLVAACGMYAAGATWFPFVPPDSPHFRFTMPNAEEHARTYQYVNVGRWLDEHAAPGDRVCTSEIGALGWTYKGEILDGIGLVSPETLPYHPVPLTQRSAGYLGAIPPAVVHDFRPEFVVSFPEFAEALFADARFADEYELAQSWPWFAGPAAWEGLDEKFWGGEIRVYRRRDLVASR